MGPADLQVAVLTYNYLLVMSLDDVSSYSSSFFAREIVSGPDAVVSSRTAPAARIPRPPPLKARPRLTRITRDGSPPCVLPAPVNSAPDSARWPSGRRALRDPVARWPGALQAPVLLRDSRIEMRAPRDPAPRCLAALQVPALLRDGHIEMRALGAELLAIFTHVQQEVDNKLDSIQDLTPMVRAAAAHMSRPASARPPVCHAAPPPNPKPHGSSIAPPAPSPALL